ncbi:MAG: riboflavin synthase [Bdellovibrionales bacterium]|nr:riboflavin synthase [Bdellovibrionales bacterium]
MFTGIIEEKAKVLKVSEGDQSLQITLARPAIFDDIGIGDSIATNGVCLTVETFDEKEMVFTIGYETLQITGWQKSDFEDAEVNLERSLKFGQRIHGHLVSGHVDTTSKVLKTEWAGDCFLMDVEVPASNSKEIWQKSSVAINGVSLTVNWVKDGTFQVCLVPETLRKTNLEKLESGQVVNIETDYYMKGLLTAKGETYA